jgi:hypothetical protein
MASKADPISVVTSGEIIRSEYAILTNLCMGYVLGCTSYHME